MTTLPFLIIAVITGLMSLFPDKFVKKSRAPLLRKLLIAATILLAIAGLGTFVRDRKKKSLVLDDL